MKYWLGVTDNSWFKFLASARPDEVNFWQPRGGATYSELTPGSLFLFKLKRPYNHVAGGAYFVKSTALPMSMAWDAFGVKNGAATRSSFESMIRKLVADPSQVDPVIGCTVLSEPFFWPESQWIADPAGWSGSIVRGRYFDSHSADGAVLWHMVEERLRHSRVMEGETARYGGEVITRPRLGQGGFRVVVTDAYRRRCAITGESTLPVLEAAHILPYAENGPHEASNGLLLRSDFHKLFDLGLVTVTPTYRIEVSPRIREEWFNGKAYYSLHGKELRSVPEQALDRPNAALLRWHNENRFRA
jgi:putative restriction endonuclease